MSLSDNRRKVIHIEYVLLISISCRNIPWRRVLRHRICQQSGFPAFCNSLDNIEKIKPQIKRMHRVSNYGYLWTHWMLQTGFTDVNFIFWVMSNYQSFPWLEKIETQFPQVPWVAGNLYNVPAISRTKLIPFSTELLGRTYIFFCSTLVLEHITGHIWFPFPYYVLPKLKVSHSNVRDLTN